MLSWLEQKQRQKKRILDLTLSSYSGALLKAKKSRQNHCPKSFNSFAPNRFAFSKNLNS